MGTGTQEENGGDNYSELLAELFAGVFPVSKEAQAAVATLFDEARRIWRDAHPKVSIPDDAEEAGDDFAQVFESIEQTFEREFEVPSSSYWVERELSQHARAAGPMIARAVEIARSLGAPPELTRAVVYDHLAERSVAEAKLLTMLATIPPSRRRSQEG